MTTFIDGPARGEALPLKRSPRLLRVTQNGPVFDALDQLEDEPAETELIYVYVLAAPVQAWVTTTAGRFPVAEYRFIDPPPGDGLVRQTHAWRGWTTRYARANPA
jgi:hypothetical protein